MPLALNNNRGSVYNGRIKIEVPEGRVLLHRMSAIVNVFSLIMIETTSRGSFNHDQNNHVSIMIRAMHCLM